MALDYDSADGVFTHLGALIARINSYGTLGLTTLPADLQTLLTAFGSSPGAWLSQEGIASSYDGLRDAVTGWRTSLARFCDSRLTDPASVLAQLGLSPSAGLSAVLPALRRAMRDASETVQVCACAATTPSAAAGNVGTGKCWVTAVLDGYNPPTGGADPDVAYLGLASEMACPSEVMTLECSSDVADGATEGGESFTWTGGPSYGDLDVRAEGSGPGPTLSVASGYGNLLSNPSLETWSGGTPSSWTTTGVTQDATTAWRGTSSAKILTNGSLVQALSGVTGRRRYHVGFAFKGGAAGGASLLVKLTGTGYTATETLTVAGGSWPATWTLYGFFCNIPSPAPSDLSLSIAVTGSALPSWVDSVSLTPAVYHGGVGVALTAGSAAFQRGDRFTFTASNDVAGKFNNFFRKWYRCQLPSAASETIAEALVA